MYLGIVEVHIPARRVCSTWWRCAGCRPVGGFLPSSRHASRPEPRLRGTPREAGDHAACTRAAVFGGPGVVRPHCRASRPVLDAAGVRTDNLPGRAGAAAADCSMALTGPRRSHGTAPARPCRPIWRLCHMRAGRPWCAARAFRPFPGTWCPGRMGLGKDKAKPAGWKARGEADMSRDEAYLNAMLRELGAAYYQTLHGEGTASEVARAVDAVADAEGRRDLAAEPGRSGVSGDAGHPLGEETVTTQPSGEGERRIVVGVDGSVPSKAALAWAVKQARLTGATVEAVIAWELPATYGYPVPSPSPTSITADSPQRCSPAPSPKPPARVSRSRSDPRWRRAALHGCCWMRQREPSCWLSAAADMADSSRPCSARSASIASTTPPAPS